MKGTIDVQIKHKDGSIETRHEHNVVFDLPALYIKSALGMPDWVHLLCGNSMNPNLSLTSLKGFDYFGLSEDEFSLTQPEYRPFALFGVESNATQWYQAVPSKVLSEKSITLQESWTVQTPMTLKGVAVHTKNMPSIFSSLNYKPRFFDGTLYCPRISQGQYTDYPYQKADFSTNVFSYTNQYANGFASSESDRTHCSIGCLPYKLANSSERIAFLNSNGERSSYPADARNMGIAIYKYPDDNTLLRSFKFSQFTGFGNNQYDSVFVINTGTKNYLFEIIRVSSSSSALIQSFTVWQIPDAALAESETIAPIKTDFLSDFWPTTTGQSYRPFVIGNYFFLFDKLFKIDDTLAVTQYHGGSTVLSTSTSATFYSNISLSDSGVLLSLPEGSYSYKWQTSYGWFEKTPYNLTAANFSTPIELAEGDVLTVSYKIEVS